MYIITGGAGFIGSCLVEALNKLGTKDILIIDNLSSSEKWKNLIFLRFDRYEHKSNQTKLLQELSVSSEKIKAVIHMGACSSTTEKDMDYLMVNNVNATKELWHFCVHHNIPFIYASSAATYGNGELGYNDDPIELDKITPINRYGYSKHLFDLWALKQKKFPKNWIGLKFFNVFGQNEYHKGDMQSLVAKAVPQILTKNSLALFKSYKPGIPDGGQQRDFIYINDVIKAILHVLQTFNANPNSKCNGIYNLGTGTARSFKDLGLAVFKSLKIAPKIDWIEMPIEIRGQYQYFTQANMDRFRSNFNFTDPFTPLEEGVDYYVQKYLLPRR